MSINFDLWERELSRLTDEKKMAGISIAVTDKTGVIWEKGFGVTSVEKPWDKMSAKTLSRIASNTKFTVGLCVMQLVEQGKMNLDSPISDYLPWFSVIDTENTKHITVRKLLNHTSGLPFEYSKDGFYDEDRSEKVLREQIASSKLIAKPFDNHYSYSNFGTRLAACAMEHITSMNFSTLCKKMVLTPLGMENSTFDICRAASYEMAIPHLRDNMGNPIVEHKIPINATRYASGGLFSNVHEMTALARVILNNGSPLISAKSFEQMIKTNVKTDDAFDGEYGLTIMKRRYNGKILIGHTGSNPPYYSCIWVDKESGYGVTFLTNTDGGREFADYLIPNFFVDSVSIYNKEKIENADC